MTTALIRYTRNSLAAGLLAVGASVIARRSYARHLSRHAAPQSGRTITADDGVRLHIDVDENVNDALTIVFVHGFAASSQEFHAQRAALRGMGRLVLFDHRGHGSSGWGRYRSATIEQLGRDLGQVIDNQPSTMPVVIVAHSMGGMATLALAGQCPELFNQRVAAVALLSTAAGRLPATKLPSGVARLAVRTHLATAATWLLWLTAPLLDGIAPFRRQWGRRWLLRRLFGGQDPPEEAARLMQDMWIRTPLSMVTAFYPALVSYNVPAALDVLQHIPVLVMSGTDDRAIPPGRSEYLAHQIGDSARLVTVNGAGHMLNLTHADEVNRALRELIGERREKLHRHGQRSAL